MSEILEKVVDTPWAKTFVVVPRRTVSRKWIWGNCYYRKVYVTYGIGFEPEHEYGNMFDVIQNTDLVEEYYS